MPLRVKCPAGHKLIVPDDRAGKLLRCPRCSEAFTVEAAQPLIPASPASAEPLREAVSPAAVDVLLAGLGQPNPAETAPSAAIERVSLPTKPPKPLPDVESPKPPSAVPASSLQATAPPPVPAELEAKRTQVESKVPANQAGSAKAEPVSVSVAPSPPRPATLPAPPIVTLPPTPPPAEKQPAVQLPDSLAPSPEGSPKPPPIAPPGNQDRAESPPLPTVVQIGEPAAPDRVSANPPAPSPPPACFPPAEPVPETPLRTAAHPDPHRLPAVYGLATCVIAAALFSLVPAAWDAVEYLRIPESQFVARWALMSLVLGLVQAAYGVYLFQLPDWASVWIVTLYCLGLAGMYAMLAGLLLLASDGSRLIELLELGDKLAGNKAVLWCLCMVSVSVILAFFAGKLSVQWHRAETLLRRAGL